MPQLDFNTFSSQIFWLVITFTIFYFVMARVAIPVIVSVRQNRQERIAGDLDRAEKSRVEAETIEQQYKSSIAETAHQSSDIMAEAAQTIATHADGEYKKLEASLATKFKAADQAVEALEQKAVDEISAISVGLSQKIIEKISAIAITEVKAKKVVENIVTQRN